VPSLVGCEPAGAVAAGVVAGACGVVVVCGVVAAAGVVAVLGAVVVADAVVLVDVAARLCAALRFAARLARALATAVCDVASAAALLGAGVDRAGGVVW
jgi:hypothetical protein